MRLRKGQEFMLRSPEMSATSMVEVSADAEERSRCVRKGTTIRLNGHRNEQRSAE